MFSVSLRLTCGGGTDVFAKELLQFNYTLFEKLQESQATWPSLCYSGGQLNLHHVALHPERATWQHLVPACARWVKTRFAVAQQLFPPAQPKTPEETKGPIMGIAHHADLCSYIIQTYIIYGSLQLWAVPDTPAHSSHSASQLYASIYLFILVPKLLKCTELVKAGAGEDSEATSILRWKNTFYPMQYLLLQSSLAVQC